MPPPLTPMRRRIDADRARLLGKKNKNTMTDVEAMLLGSYSNWISLNDQRMLSGSPAIKAQMKQMMHQIMQLESMTNPNTLYPNIKPNSKNNNNKKPVIVPIAGDGRCLFRSIARAAYAPKNQVEETELADDLRREAQRIICDDPEQYAFIMGEMNGGRAKYANANRNVGEYCRRVREKRNRSAVNSWEWGGVPEVHVLSFLLERAILVYEEETKTGSGKYALVDVAGADFGRPIHLWYNGRNHYQLFAVPPRAKDLYSSANNIPPEAAPYIVGAAGNTTTTNNKNKKSNSNNSNNNSNGFGPTTPALFPTTRVRPTVQPPRNGS